MRWRLATALVLSAATVDGCACEAPTPVLHVSPGTTVQVGELVTFDSRPTGDDPPDHVNTDAKVAWDLDGDGRFELQGGRVVQRRFDVPNTYLVTFDAETLVYNGFFDNPVSVHGYVTKKIVAVAPPGQGNQVPTASFTSSPEPGYTERDITFDASASSDADGQIVKYEWDWNTDGTYDDSTASPTTTHKYAFSGTYPVRLRVTDDAGANGITDGTVRVQDGVPPSKVIAREATGVSAAAAGSPFTLSLGRVSLTNGTTTVSGTKLVTAGIRAHGRIRFMRSPRVFGGLRSARWAGAVALVQRGSAGQAKLAGQGYLLLWFTKRDSLCLAGTATGGFRKAFSGKLAVAGGKGFGARLRGPGTFAPPARKAGKPILKGRLKLRRVHKPRGLPKACRKLVRDLPR